MLATRKLILHVSDWHLAAPGPAWSQVLNRRLLGYLRWRWLRGKKHALYPLERFFALKEDLSPAKILVTGDLTHLGLPEEFDLARTYLESLGPPAQVSVVPGNHDSYAPEPWEATYAKWGSYLGEGSSLREIFPRLQQEGPLALIGLSTACPNVPPFARGRLGKEQLKKLASLLRETGREGLLRIVYLHHPPLEGVVSRRKALKDLEPLKEVLYQEGVEMVLYGHTHKNFRHLWQTAHGRCLIFGVPSLTYVGEDFRRRARFYALTFEGGELTFESYAWQGRDFARELRLTYAIGKK